MARGSLLAVRAGEALWLAPFLCVGLMSLGLFRTLPHFPPPAHSRTVTDITGKAVHIAMPFRGIVLTPTNFPGTFLEDTHSPGLLSYAGNSGLRKYVAKGATTWVFPQILDSKLWNDRLFRATASPFTEIESLMACSPSVYVGCGGPPDFVRRVGLPVFNCGSMPERELHASFLYRRVSCGSRPDLRRAYYPESYLFPTLRSYSALIGNPDFAEMRVAAFCKAIDDLQADLHPSSLTHSPRAWVQGEENGTLARAGIVDATRPGVVAAKTRKYNPDDPEQLLAMDPDMIFLVNEGPKEFDRDIRWQGLRAVRERRVYRRPGQLEWWTAGVLFKPVETRWLAEIAHPDHLQPKVRQLLRDGMLDEFGYRLTEEQIDLQLHVAENTDSASAERFTRSRK